MIPRWALALSGLLGSCCWECAGSPLTPVDDSLLTGYTIDQTNCVTANRGDAGAIDKCRAQVKHNEDLIQAAKFGDGGAQ